MTKSYLNAYEKRIVKGFLQSGKKIQEILHLVNTNRDILINQARISEAKTEIGVLPASDEELRRYRKSKETYDPITGLNPVDDERLMRAREAMILAVQVFNTPSMKFKSEAFAVHAIIAWTYLLHEYCIRNDLEIYKPDGQTISLRTMMDREWCPLTNAIKDNIRAIIDIRNEVEHSLLDQGDLCFISYYQACALNFDKTLCEYFGARLTLSNEIGMALQFAKMDIHNLAMAENYDIPAGIEKLSRHLSTINDEQYHQNTEYRFRIVYTLENSSKSDAHIHFVSDVYEEDIRIREVMIKKVALDTEYPFKVKDVVSLIQAAGYKNFNQHKHTQFWKEYKARPKTDSKQPENTKKEWCIYHQAHGDYTYSQGWVDFILERFS